MSDSGENKKWQVGKMIANSFKTTFSTSIRTSDSVNYIKRRGFDMYENVSGVTGILWKSLTIIFYACVGMFRLTMDIPHALSRAAHNNFRLGLENLKSNNLIDARIRFLLSNLFFSKSATTKYYIAYVYYRQQNFTKSLNYLKQAISLNPRHDKSLALLQVIESELQKD